MDGGEGCIVCFTIRLYHLSSYIAVSCSTHLLVEFAGVHLGPLCQGFRNADPQRNVMDKCTQS